jgi:hypothetical protein
LSKVRGTSFIGTLDYVRASHGERALVELLGSLPPPARTIIGDGRSLFPHAWYEAAALSALTRSIDRAFGSGDLALARVVGKHVAFSDVNRFFKWLFRISGPGTLFARAASVWKNYYDGGIYVFEGAQDGQASIRIEDWLDADDVLCKRLEGWIERAFELTLGAGLQPDIRETHHRGFDPGVSQSLFCRFEARWKV